MGWENRERDMSIQTYPSQSIAKTAPSPLSDYSSAIFCASSPTPGYDSRKTVLTLKRNGLEGWRGRFAMIPSHLPNREDGITDLRVLPALPSPFDFEYATHVYQAP